MDEHVVFGVTSPLGKRYRRLYYRGKGIGAITDLVERETDVWVVSPRREAVQWVIHRYLQRKWSPPKGAPPY